MLCIPVATSRLTHAASAHLSLFPPSCRFSPPPLALAPCADAAADAGAEGATGSRAKTTPSDMADFAMPPAGRSLPTLWVENSSHAADHAAAGDFQARLKEEEERRGKGGGVGSPYVGFWSSLGWGLQSGVSE